MSSHIDALDLLESGMRIDLGGAQRSMAQERLDSADIGAVIEHRRRKGMAQHVRRVFLERTHLSHTRAHDFI